MSIAIGIDLGTTNSVAGVRKTSTRILPNAEDDDLTPSCVAKTGNQFIVGKPARDFFLQNPANTVLSVKRLMGRRFHDPKVQKLITENRYSYEIISLSEGSDNSVGIRLEGQEFTPEFISAQILSKIKMDSEKDLSQSVEYAVVTVPAYFNDKQKHATRTAAMQAGLKVQRLLPEPTAAAIAFGVDEMAADESKTVMVYDFGGGTFDVSILTISGGHFLEQGKTGDMWLGGDDIDRLLEDFVLEKANLARSQIEDLESLQKHRFKGEFKHRVEQAKIDLSSKDKVFVEMLGHTLDVEIEITRSEFEALIAPMVERSIALMLEALKQIDFELDLVDQVLLVGGSSSIPLVLEKVSAVFGSEKVKVHPRPMLAVAEGAAILAHRLSNADDSQMGDIIHTTSHDYYLKLAGQQQHLLIPSNTILPHRVEQTFKLVSAEQRLVHFQFSNLVNGGFELVGDLWLSHDFDHKDKAPLDVVLTFDIDENNLISVGARFKDHPEVEITRTLSRGQVDEVLYQALEAGIAKVNSGDTALYDADSYLESAVRIAADIPKIIDPETQKIDQKLVARLKAKQETNDILVEKGESPWGRLYYMEDLLQDYGSYIDPQTLPSLFEETRLLRAEIETFENATRIERALEKVGDLLEKHAAVASCFANIQHAIDIAEDSDPSQAAVLQSHLEEAEASFSSGNIPLALDKLLEAKKMGSRVYSEHSEQVRKIETDIETYI